MQKTDFYYDIVFCIDKTKNCFDQYAFISGFLDSFGNQIKNQFRSADIRYERIRAKIIEFGDYKADEQPIVDHGFFDLSFNSGEFSDLLYNIRINGDYSEKGYSNGFEAITCAIKSDWDEQPDSSGKQVIVVFTKNYPLPIEETCRLPNYPADYPKTLGELKSLWESKSDMNGDKKMLITFCPMNKAKSCWTPLMKWDGVISIDSQDINDCTSDFIMETLLIDLI